MSRFRNAARSLTSGYAALAANGFYLLASIPLALRYLSADEFALWNLVVQIAGYLTLVDVGMTGAVSRFLIDHKDDRQGVNYGSVIKTGAMVLLVQGACIIAGGILLSLVLPALLDVPAQFVQSFGTLIVGQCLLLGIFFVARILISMLQAHQRFDVINYSQILQVTVGFVIQWVTFHLGWGLYSLLAASVANAVVGVAHNLFWVLKLQLFPSGGRWGHARAKVFKEVFAFGRDLFLIAVGMQLLNASQVVIIARTLGLTAVTVWTIATKTFLLGQQVVARISDFSSSALSEMVVRGERDRLRRRFRELLILTASAAVFVGASVALCNGSFMGVWLKGGSRTIAAAEIKDLPSFTSKLKQQADPVSQFLWQQISETSREAMRTNATTEVLRAALVSELNEIIRTNAIYQPQRFVAVALSQETRTLLGRKLRGGWLARFNRLLLEDAYPQDMEKSIKFAVAWPWRNDLLLGLLLVITCVTRCHISLTGQTKEIGGMRYVYFLEGVSFVIAACLAAPRWGMTGILVAAVVANLLWSGGYGFWRTSRYFGIPVTELLFGWLRPAYRYLLVMMPITVVLGWTTYDWPVLQRFLTDSFVLILIGPLLMWTVGLTKELHNELKERLVP